MQLTWCLCFLVHAALSSTTSVEVKRHENIHVDRSESDSARPRARKTLTDHHGNDELTYLQVTRDHRLHKVNSTEVVLANVDRPLTVSFPVAWFHVPKCGSTFLNSLLNLPGACDFVSANLTPDADFASMAVLSSYMDPPEYQHYIDINAVCPGSFLDPPEYLRPDGPTWTWFHHSGVNSIYHSKVQGHGFTILRQPEQRIISAWNHEQHSWPLHYYKRWAKTMREFAEAVSGCAVKMMTRDGIAIGQSNLDPHAPCGDPVHSTDEETDLAVNRLRDGFVFVGIVEEWDMSICLLHKMFGWGPCHGAEFGNARPGTSATSFYNTSDLNGFVDVHDGKLYEEAVQIYRSLLNKYDVAASTCEPCFEQGAEVASETTM